EEGLAVPWHEAVRRALREHEEVALLVSQRTVVRLEDALAAVDEVTDVAVGIAQEPARGFRALAHEDRELLVVQDPLPVAVGAFHVRRLQSVQVIGPRVQRTLDGDPRRRRMGPVQVRGAAVERLASVLLLVRPFGQADVRLPGDPPLLQREHRAPLLRRLPGLRPLLGLPLVALVLLALAVPRPANLRAITS